MKTQVFTAALLLSALLACKSKHKVDGSVTVNGSPFVAETCGVATMNLNFNGVQSTTHSVTLTDAAGRRLSFSDSDGVAVGFNDGAGTQLDAGRGCGSVRFVGSTSDPAKLKVHLDADCRGSGIETRAKAEISGCGTFGADLLP
ncbi:MAG TPA: hypothetical protein PKD61_18265 [Polyangiaceae bacterium]|nr:hypothetical protein [Polyangiaceae bacterium]